MGSETRDSQSLSVPVAAETGKLPAIPTIQEMLATTDPDGFVARYSDIAAVNLACAAGLPNASESEFPKYLALLDTIAEAVRRQTERSWRLFKLKPGEFHHSENVFRVFTMEHIFRVQFGVRYDPVVREANKERRPWITADSTEIFIHGILGPKRTGTCSSLPTFAIAVGRRLGYPLKLILVPNHTLYRWDDGNEAFNLQPTEAGGDIKTDEYFHEWPRKWDEADYALNARTKVWLHSLTQRQEVSKFLCNRALMLRGLQRDQEAFQAIDAAGRFDSLNPACAAIRRDIFGMRQARALAPPPAVSVFTAGPVQMPIEPGREQVLSAVNPFRDRSKDPRRLCVRITPLPDARSARQQPTIITILRGSQRKEC